MSKVTGKVYSSPKIANQDNKLEALKFVKNFKANFGTEMLSPIYEALFEKSPLRLNHHILLSPLP